MASETDIANLALAHLGDDATVSSISPPEGSAQAEHCARFYPIARDNLLAMHRWNFATVRITGASLTPDATGWAYAYAVPSEAIEIISVLHPEAPDDYSAPSYDGNSVIGTFSMYQPQPFAVEKLAAGDDVIYTNQENAVIRYTKRVTDTTKYPPLVVSALSRLLASYMAGPIYKGDTGMNVAKAQYQMFLVEFNAARQADMSQRDIRPQRIVDWISNR